MSTITCAEMLAWVEDQDRDAPYDEQAVDVYDKLRAYLSCRMNEREIANLHVYDKSFSKRWPIHEGKIHGRESEELRNGIERILRELPLGVGV